MLQYFSMNVAHLHDEELAHELAIRRIDTHNEPRSVLERKCRADLKREASQKSSEIEYEITWTTIIEELERCDKQVQEIKQILESRTYKKAPDQLNKSRLLHYLFRLLRVKAHTREESELNSISEMAGECVRLLNTFYSIASPYPEIRRAEMGRVNDMVNRLRDEFSEDNGAKPTNSGKLPNPEVQKDNEDGCSNNQLEGLFALPDDDEVEKLSEAAGGQLTEEVEILRAENSQLKSILDQLLTRMESLETQLHSSDKSHQHSKNSTSVGEPRNLGDTDDSDPVVAPKPKFSYHDFMHWLARDQNLIENITNKNPLIHNDPRSNVPSRGLPNTDAPANTVQVAREICGQRLPIHKWKLSYDGADNGRRLIEFLREVEFNARSEGFNHQELYNSAYHLLIGKARTWYMEVNANNELGTWNQLVAELKREFLPSDLDYQYERQAHLRKQGMRERFQDYYLEMTRILRNMTVLLDEAKRFQILFRNLRSEYKSAMLAANIDSIAKMREFGKNFDAINWQWFSRADKDSGRGYRAGERQVNELGERRRPLPNNNRPWHKGNNDSNQGKKEFHNSSKHQQFKNSSNKTEKPDEQNTNSKMSERKPEQTSKQDYQKPTTSKSLSPLEKILKAYVPVKKGTCFNCHNFGHNISQCKLEKQTFCEVCGFPGFIQQDCPYCTSKNVDKTAQ